MKIYLTITEFGDVHMTKGELQKEIISAANDGYYDIIDITNPNKPLRYFGEDWVVIESFPYIENQS